MSRLLCASLCCFLLAGFAWAQVADEKPDRSTPFFESPAIQEVRFTVAPADWQKLQANYLEDTYYPANFEWQGTRIEDIAIRSRGNGSRSAVKPALKISFDKYQKQNFLGLTTLTLLNLVQDPPMIRDWLSMQVFRRAGEPAPRSWFAKLYVNDEYYGLYLAVEPVDKNFLRRHYDDDAGWLYDYEHTGYAYNWEYLGPDPAVYGQFQIETNKTKPNLEALISLIRTLDQTSPETFVQNLSPVLDLGNLLRHLAVEVYLAEQDGFVGEQGTNNFYLYQGTADPRHRLIPWDKNATLCDYSYPMWRNMDRNLITRKALQVPELRLQFLQHLQTLADSLGGEEGWLDQTARFAIERIREAALADSKKPYSNAEFEQSLIDTRYFIAQRATELAAQIERETRPQ